MSNGGTQLSKYPIFFIEGQNMTEDIIKRLEKLEQFKKDTIADISDLDTKLEYMTNDLDILMRKNLTIRDNFKIENDD